MQANIYFSVLALSLYAQHTFFFFLCIVEDSHDYPNSEHTPLAVFSKSGFVMEYEIFLTNLQTILHSTSIERFTKLLFLGHTDQIVSNKPYPQVF